MRLASSDRHIIYIQNQCRQHELTNRNVYHNNALLMRQYALPITVYNEYNYFVASI